MFEVAELGHKLSKTELADKLPALQMGLLQAQRQIKDSSHAVVILVSGVEGAGKGGVVNRLNEWLDSRGIKTTAFWKETDEEALRPDYWRFWRALPGKGEIGIMFGSWYTRPIVERVYTKAEPAIFERRLQEINEFEQMLSDDGVIIIKLWFHLSKKLVQKNIEADRKQKLTRRNPYSKKYSRLYDCFLDVSELAVRTTDAPYAPWHVIEASDSRYRDYTAGQVVLEALQAACEKKPAKPKSKRKASMKPEVPALTVLDNIDLRKSLENEQYDKRLPRWQSKLQKLSWQLRAGKRSVVVVFEGWDAAGKGSTIRRLTKAVDARLCQVISVSAPTDEEAAHHFLWRFWRHLPMAGNLTIYDRSWYGRVLVERVEGYAEEAQWQRAYNEINLFEQQLHDSGIVLLKFWLHISPEEQLRRFHEREKTPWKRYKITDDDWRNRERRDDYRLAVHDMVTHTSTAAAPWHLISAEDKKYARVEVLKTVCKAMKAALDE